MSLFFAILAVLLICSAALGYLFAQMRQLTLLRKINKHTKLLIDKTDYSNDLQAGIVQGRLEVIREIIRG